MALLARARKLGERLPSDACCPACLLQLAQEFSAAPTALARARHDLHQFWNECAWESTLSGTRASPIQEVFEQKRVKLRRARRVCRLHMASPTSSDILHDYIAAVCACLHHCLSLGKSAAVQRSANRKRAFENSGGHWPRTCEDLFPCTVQLGVQSVMFWCTTMESPYPVMLLTDMLRIAHPLVLSAIIESPAMHEKLLSTAILPRLGKFLTAAQAALKDEGDVSGIPESPAQNMEATVSLLASVHDSPDALPNSLMLLAKGSEAGLFKGLELVLYALDRTAEPLAPTVVLLCAALYPCIPPPSKLMCPRILDHVTPCDALSIFGVLHRALKTMARTRRICSGPGCTTIAHQPADRDGEAHFLVCARCKLSRYCSRDCQAADWKRGSEAPHKKVCPLLCRMLAEAPVDMEPAAFEATVGKLDWEQADLRVLSLFTLAMHLLPAEILVRAGDIHGALVDGEELSEAEKSALASIERIKRELQEL